MIPYRSRSYDRFRFTTRNHWKRMEAKRVVDKKRKLARRKGGKLAPSTFLR